VEEGGVVDMARSRMTVGWEEGFVEGGGRGRERGVSEIGGGGGGSGKGLSLFWWSLRAVGGWGRYGGKVGMDVGGMGRVREVVRA